MQLVPMNQNQTMSSREIADLVEKRHDNVKRTIETLINQGVISNPQIEDGEKSGNGVTEKLYMIGKRDSYVIVAQLSPEFTARLVDRWQELEAQTIAPAFQIPTTLSGALRLAAEQAEIIEQQTALIEQQRPAVEFVDKFVEAKSSKNLSDVAKIIGWKPRAFIAKLAEEKIIFKRSGSWIPYQEHIDMGRFTVKAGNAEGHAFHQTRVEPKGIEWLAGRFG